MKRTTKSAACGHLFVAALLLSGRLAADITVPGADGSDGKLSVDNTTLEIDLSKAKDGNWDAAGGDIDGDGLGDGVYDAQKWAVIFKYESVELKRNAVVRFKPHPSNAPIVWLVTGDVTIRDNGWIDLYGQNWTGRGIAAGGPGGFRGATAWLANDVGEGGGGFGPGGGHYDTQRSARSGVYATKDNYGDGTLYGNDRILPLIGGSGGAATRGNYSWSGGGGAGAILIAAQRKIDIAGANGIFAIGGTGPSAYGAGSGGAISLVGGTIGGTGRLLAYSGGRGGTGRIRIEANEITFNGMSDPTYTHNREAFEIAELWPGDSSPVIRVSKVAGKSVPDDPRGQLDFPKADITLREKESIKVELDARNVPSDWIVTVRVVAKNGFVTQWNATRIAGDDSHSTWETEFSLTDGFSAIQVRAAKP